MFEQFDGKKVAILGLGVEGISSLKFFKENGAEVAVKDQKEEGDVDQVILTEAKAYTSDFRFGSTYLQNLLVYDSIVRAPSIRPDKPELLEASHNGVKITSNVKTFFDICPAKIIGVTGTKGKGTTTALIGEMIKKAGFRTFVGGNIGKPPLDFINELGTDNWVVLELSSFQLMDIEKSPHIAVVLMVTSEHLDWHKDTTEYIEAKINIVSHQKKEDYSVINVDYLGSSGFSDKTLSQKVYVSLHREQDNGVYVKNEIITRTLKGKTEEILPTKEIFLRGNHNVENIAAAAAAASIAGVSANEIAEVARTFKGLPHRLEFVREVSGVKYYNDSFSTTPETAVAAIKSFTEPLIIILGGSVKNSDYRELGKEVANAKNIKGIILVGETGPKIRQAIESFEDLECEMVEGAKSVQEIVLAARSLSTSGDVVLLSPASASFDMFKNYKDRGEQFKEAVNEI